MGEKLHTHTHTHTQIKNKAAGLFGEKFWWVKVLAEKADDLGSISETHMVGQN